MCSFLVTDIHVLEVVGYVTRLGLGERLSGEVMLVFGTSNQERPLCWMGFSACLIF